MRSGLELQSDDIESPSCPHDLNERALLDWKKSARTNVSLKLAFLAAINCALIHMHTCKEDVLSRCPYAGNSEVKPNHTVLWNVTAMPDIAASEADEQSLGQKLPMFSDEALKQIATCGGGNTPKVTEFNIAERTSTLLHIMTERGNITWMHDRASTELPNQESSHTNKSTSVHNTPCKKRELSGCKKSDTNEINSDNDFLGDKAKALK